MYQTNKVQCLHPGNRDKVKLAGNIWTRGSTHFLMSKNSDKELFIQQTRHMRVGTHTLMSRGRGRSADSKQDNQRAHML